MNEIKTLQTTKKFSHASITDFSLFTGKLFLKDSIDTTSCEISIGSLDSGQSIPFFHSHKQDEEIYIILAGSGVFQIDDEIIDIEKGSFIRVATGSDRCFKCTSTETMVYICIQAKQNSLEQCTMEDGVITERVSKL